MNQYHITLKEVPFALHTDGPRHADMLRTKMNMRKKREAQIQVQMIALFKRDI